MVRHCAMAFGVGAAAACTIRAGLWLTGNSVAEMRHWRVHRRYRTCDALSPKSWQSWEKYKDSPQFKHLYEREVQLQKDWQRYKEKLKGAPVTESQSEQPEGLKS